MPIRRSVFHVTQRLPLEAMLPPTYQISRQDPSVILRYRNIQPRLGLIRRNSLTGGGCVLMYAVHLAPCPSLPLGNPCRLRREPNVFKTNTRIAWQDRCRPRARSPSTALTQLGKQDGYRCCPESYTFRYHQQGLRGGGGYGGR